jgi:hypothetical protein
MEKPTGIKLPSAFPPTLEIETTDFHIPSATDTTANLTQNQNPKGPSPVRLTFAPFRLILQLEKTVHFEAPGTRRPYAPNAAPAGAAFGDPARATGLPSIVAGGFSTGPTADFPGRFILH